jgi:hypothetical protein
MRNILALALAVLVGGSTAASASPSPSGTDPAIRVFESQDDSAITQGETVLEIAPDAAYAAAVDYPRWTAMFPDIRQVIVTRQVGIDARVTFVHADGNRDNLHFHNQPAARILWFEDTGGRAEVWAEIVFIPGDRPGTTRVRSRLYADVHGLASLVVSDRKLRGIRQQRVRDDLTNLRAYFQQQAMTAMR